MDSKLGRSFQNCESSSRKFLFGGVYGRAFTTSSSQWQIPKEFLPKRVARSVKHAYGQYLIIALSTYGRWSVDIVLRTKVVRVIFWHASLAKKQGGMCWHSFWVSSLPRTRSYHDR